MADTPQASATSSLEDQIRLREQKAQQLREKGADPYGNGVVVPHTTGFVRIRHEDDDAAALEQDQSEPYGVAGRVVALRSMGKASFLSLRDRTGDLQIFVKKDKVGDAAYETLKLTDLGDIVFARGKAGFSSEEIPSIAGKQAADLVSLYPARKRLEVVHRNDLVLL